MRTDTWPCICGESDCAEPVRVRGPLVLRQCLSGTRFVTRGATITEVDPSPWDWLPDALDEPAVLRLVTAVTARRDEA